MTAAPEHQRNQDDPAAIRADIDQTRQRISHDLDELGEKLNPQNVKAQIKDGVREATIGRVEDMARNAGDGLMQTIRDNPIPAAMAGIGLAWLLMNRGSRQPGSSRSEYRYSSEAERSGYNAESYRYESQQSRFEGITDTVKEKAQGVVSAATGTGGEGVRKLEDTFSANPLAIAAAAVAAGLAVGLVTPETSTERRFMGDMSSGVRDKVADVARETGEKVSAVAERVVEETKTAAREEGLAGSDAGTNPYI
jgi:hypothetical protein